MSILSDDIESSRKNCVEALPDVELRIKAARQFPVLSKTIAHFSGGYDNSRNSYIGNWEDRRMALSGDTQQHLQEFITLKCLSKMSAKQYEASILTFIASSFSVAESVKDGLYNHMKMLHDTAKKILDDQIDALKKKLKLLKERSISESTHSALTGAYQIIQSDGKVFEDMMPSELENIVALEMQTTVGTSSAKVPCISDFSVEERRNFNRSINSVFKFAAALLAKHGEFNATSSIDFAAMKQKIIDGAKAIVDHSFVDAAIVNEFFSKVFNSLMQQKIPDVVGVFVTAMAPDNTKVFDKVAVQNILQTVGIDIDSYYRDRVQHFSKSQKERTAEKRSKTRLSTPRSLDSKKAEVSIVSDIREHHSETLAGPIGSLRDV